MREQPMMPPELYAPEYTFVVQRGWSLTGTATPQGGATVVSGM